MKSSSTAKQSIIKLFVKHALLPVTIVIICLWLYGLVYVLQSKEKHKSSPNTSSSPPQFDISSYLLSTAEYHSSIPCISYDKQSLHVPVVPKAIDYFPMSTLMSAWDFDDTSTGGWLNSPAHPNKGQSIPRFDFMIEAEKKIAEEYQKEELPFIVYNVPQLEQSIAETFTMSNLLKSFGDAPHFVEKSASNRFTYYRQQKHGGYPGWTPPQQDVSMTFHEYLSLVEAAESYEDINRIHPLHYLSVSAGEGYRTDWIRKSLTIFEKKQSFFVVDPSGMKGINCRFGMKGVSAAVHYDGGRNFIAMMRGRKRYVLLPPSECPKLELYPRGHPSARHSRVDWSNVTEMAQYEQLYHASATEAIISEGDVLYIPSYWFHYIVSQDASIQCNTRSGDSDKGREDVLNCGFYTNNAQKDGNLRTREKQQ